MKRTLTLIILDGWGIGEPNESNPIHVAKPRFVEYACQYFPYGALKASGISVGLPWGEPGNSEVGHLTIGAGRVLYQHYPKISIAIQDGSFFENYQLKKAFLHSQENKSAVHLVGLLTEGNVHAHLDHLLALIEMAKKEKCERLCIHLITDGRDSPPHSSQKLIKIVQEKIKECGIGTIASVMGRYYAMNRDSSLDRTKKAYETLMGQALVASTPEEIIQKSYSKNLDDEYIEPGIVKEPHPIQNNDAIIFFNFREDSIRQLTEIFVNPDFKAFETSKLENIFAVTMTQYFENITTNTAFPNEKIEKPLGKILSENNRTQLRLTETEKYAHVTYFFNGLEEKPLPNEYRVIIPSEKNLRPETHPQMMTDAITNRALVSLRENSYDFILINYPNPDIVAHTGSFEATKKAIEIIDQALIKIIQLSMEQNHILIITSDHGNAESVLNSTSGETETSHNPNSVPFYLIAKEFARASKNYDPWKEIPTIGLLSDIAPTILELMNLPKPKEMTGQSLLEQLTNF